MARLVVARCARLLLLIGLVAGAYFALSALDQPAARAGEGTPLTEVASDAVPEVASEVSDSTRKVVPAEPTARTESPKPSARKASPEASPRKGESAKAVARKVKPSKPKLQRVAPKAVGHKMRTTSRKVTHTEKTTRRTVTATAKSLPAAPELPDPKPQDIVASLPEAPVDAVVSHLAEQMASPPKAPSAASLPAFLTEPLALPEIRSPAIPTPTTPEIRGPAIPTPPEIREPAATSATLPQVRGLATAALNPRLALLLSSTPDISDKSVMPVNSHATSSHATPSRTPHPRTPPPPGEQSAGAGHLRDAGSGASPPLGTVPSSWWPDIPATSAALPANASSSGRTVRYSGPPS
ncbi:hypothetical protein [Actinoplanes sp. NPDC023714]|uniref:hypothetical protein n=1 Tax=Actinoplanes sp. NPDC023714 TaxID=3154322 RepID=UPI0033DA1316